jgi:hypothetical protein
VLISAAISLFCLPLAHAKNNAGSFKSFFVQRFGFALIFPAAISRLLKVLFSIAFLGIMPSTPHN